ncbi:MAG: hypothetical protein J6B89_03140 [Bacilli bacterium]|nr:hypothetical protein [Bacilli bacterium]
MAGISILIVNLWLFIVLVSSFIGFILLVVSIILYLRNKKDQVNKKLDVYKKIAIILLVISILFQIPLGISVFGVIVNSKVQNFKDKKELESIENKVSVQQDKWKQGFDYNGKHLIPVNIFMNNYNYHSYGKFKNLDKIGALVIKDSYNYYSLYQINNNSGYKIYYVWVESFAGGEYYSRTFVDKNDYTSVLDYYSTSNFSVSALWKSAPVNTTLRNNWKKLELNVNSERDKLISLSHAVLDNVSNKKRTIHLYEDDYDCILFKIRSDDGVFTIDLSIYTKDDEMILYLNEYKVENEIVNKYKQMLFSLINDSQVELLQKN